jgi:hypothetical protein
LPETLRSRNGTGVHWRSGTLGGMRLGEDIAIGIMQEHKLTKVAMTLSKSRGGGVVEIIIILTGVTEAGK